MAPERAGAFGEGRVDAGGDGEAVVAVVGRIGDGGGKPGPEGGGGGLAGEAGGKARGVAEGEVEPEEEALAGGERGLDEGGKLRLGRGAGAVVPFGGAFGIGAADPDGIGAAGRAGGQVGGRPVGDEDAVKRRQAPPRAG